MINWKEISEKCLNAYETMKRALNLSEALGANSVHLLYQNGIPFNIRDLFDFFDAEGIIVSIAHNHELKVSYFLITIGTAIDTTCPAFIGFPTRTEAEQQAFTKAFSILEERISK